VGQGTCVRIGQSFFIEIRFNSPTSHFISNFVHVDVFLGHQVVLLQVFFKATRIEI
jgi:hypothetical protein